MVTVKQETEVLTVVPLHDDYIYVNIKYNPKTHKDEFSLPALELNKYMTLERAYNSIVTEFGIHVIRYSGKYVPGQIYRVCQLFKEPEPSNNVARIKLESSEYFKLLFRYPYLEELVKNVIK